MENNSFYTFEAGLVLSQSFIPLLFERLVLTKENKFIDEQSQLTGLLSLIYLASESDISSEKYKLSKLLCGLDPNTVITTQTELSQDKKVMINFLIQNIISQWTAIGQSSLNGFRGNWFLRSGQITGNEETWMLHVEKKPYDVLLQKAPFSFSVISLPWMKKPIHVIWNY